MSSDLQSVLEILYMNNYVSRMVAHFTQWLLILSIGAVVGVTAVTYDYCG